MRARFFSTITAPLGAALGLALSATGPAHLAHAAQEPVIDVAFVLDTTGSMSDLIDGAKKKIWSIASEILNTEEQSTVRFALVAYRDRGDAYVTKITDLTDDINGVYGDLLEYKAQGGGDRPESVNQALNEAVTQLSWTNQETALRMVFLVGDSPPNTYQDDVDYDRTCEIARQRDIVVNTALAGDAEDTRAIWKAISQLCGGSYAEIPQSGGMQRVVTPYDDQIDTLQKRISDTVLPYGTRQAQAYLAEQKAQNMAADGAVSSDMAAVRMKAGKLNRAVTGGAHVDGGGDLVEDVEDGKIKLDAVPETELPSELRALAPEDRAAELARRIETRSAANDQLGELVAQRDAWLAEQASRTASATSDAFDAKVRDAVRVQAEARGIVYK